MRTAKIILMILAGIVLAAGTIVEKLHDNTFATEHIYGAWWFYVLLALVALGAIHSIVHDKMWHKPWQLLIYGSVVVILGGGALTAWTGLHGSITLHPGELPLVHRLDQYEVGVRCSKRNDLHKIAPLQSKSAVLTDGALC